jgi:hypothetical protein
MRALVLLVLAVSVRLASAQGMPDLMVYVPALMENEHEELKSIGPDDCTLQPSDRCVDGPGLRKLLRFSVLVLNRGDADLFLGTPTAGDPRFVFSQCHNHFHFESFARYELRPRGGAVPIKLGQKRSFCIEDLRADPDDPKARACTSDADCDGHGKCANGVCQYNCTYQGIQPGRGDIYESNLDCQWIDTTDVAPGEYDLWVFVNTEGLLPESDLTNDSAMIPVTVGPAADAPVPTVKVRVKKKAKVGRPLKIAWKTKLAGGLSNVAGYDVFLARDGVNFTELLATGVDAKKYKWTVAGAASQNAAIKIVAWTKALQRGSGTSRPLRIVP